QGVSRNASTDLPGHPRPRSGPRALGDGAASRSGAAGAGVRRIARGSVSIASRGVGRLSVLEGRVAAVVGGTSGIGLALARRLADAGADVAPISRKQDQVDAAAADVEARGRRAARVTADVADRQSLEHAMQQTAKQLGKIDILVNCAGITKRTPTLDV